MLLLLYTTIQNTGVGMEIIYKGFELYIYWVSYWVDTSALSTVRTS
jgi:hypothetical protein